MSYDDGQAAACKLDSRMGMTPGRHNRRTGEVIGKRTIHCTGSRRTSVIRGARRLKAADLLTLRCVSVMTRTDGHEG